MTSNSKIKINLDALKSRREWKRHKVVDGHNVFRILPPFGETSNGYPYRKWQIIWGLKDAETGRKRPFASSITSKKRCPVVEFAAELKKRSDSLRADLQRQGVSEDTIRDKLKSLNELVSDLSPKTVYTYNAVDRSGEVGLLELKSTAHKKMKAQMNQYIQDYNQDPTSLNSSDDDSGVWFDITRQGLGRDTEYDVKKCQSKRRDPSGRVIFEDDRTPLPEAVSQNFENLAYDLSSVYQVKTYDELKEVLDANMEELMERANLPADTVTTPKTSNVTNLVKTQPKKTGTVALKLDDEEDEEDTTVTSTAAMNTGLDDDFFAQADALLNS